MARAFTSSTLVAALMVIFCLGGTLALECYNCFSAKDPDCASESRDVLAKFSQNCSVIPGRNTSCQKIYQKLEGDLTPRVTRQCSGVNRLECIERVGTRGVRAWYCHCDQKHCNGASQLSIAFSSLLLVAVALVMANFDR